MCTNIQKFIEKYTHIQICKYIYTKTNKHTQRNTDSLIYSQKAQTKSRIPIYTKTNTPTHTERNIVLQTHTHNQTHTHLHKTQAPTHTGTQKHSHTNIQRNIQRTLRDKHKNRLTNTKPQTQNNLPTRSHTYKHPYTQ